jgi:hypothetical protein
MAGRPTRTDGNLHHAEHPRLEEPGVRFFHPLAAFNGFRRPLGLRYLFRCRPRMAEHKLRQLISTRGSLGRSMAQTGDCWEACGRSLPLRLAVGGSSREKSADCLVTLGRYRTAGRLATAFSASRRALLSGVYQ